MEAAEDDDSSTAAAAEEISIEEHMVRYMRYMRYMCYGGDFDRRAHGARQCAAGARTVWSWLLQRSTCSVCVSGLSWPPAPSLLALR